MKLKINSNFHQWYDKYFDSDGLEFRRITTDGPNRPEMFDLFKKWGILTPLFGKISTFIIKEYDKDKKVVIYDNIWSHCGENKRIITFSEALLSERDKYMCEFVEFDKTLFTDYIAKSTRQLFIGNLVYQYDYYSYNDWRSNYGRTNTSEPIQIDLPKWREKIYYPLFAIDYVGPQTELKAIDFNIAPGVNGINLGKLISGEFIVSEIKRWLSEYMK
ncbi:MAG TPA: hypothetical protein VFV86_06265 [Nitrososphaeraceae archaeon]|nr:hypothetical protein [Nitrososphaeraceae archaeon]